MAEKYDLLKKAYETAEKVIEDCYVEIKNNERMVGQTSGVIQEGVKEIGLRVQELKDKGSKGTELKDFAGDAEIKKMVASIEQFFGSLEKELGKITATHKNAKLKGVDAFWNAKTDLEKEIKDRKKAVSTKLGVGNKSLPDMEKMLTAMNKYKDTASFLGVAGFVPEEIAQHRREFGYAVKDEIAKSKDLRLTAQQEMLDEQALNERNLAKNIGLCKTALTDATEAQKAAKIAAGKKDANGLKQQQQIVVKALTQVKTLELIFVRAYKDDWIKTKIAGSSIKSKIEASFKGTKQIREAIEVIDLQVKALDL